METGIASYMARLARWCNVGPVPSVVSTPPTVLQAPTDPPPLSLWQNNIGIPLLSSPAHAFFPLQTFLLVKSLRKEPASEKPRGGTEMERKEK